ncbi:MAG: PEP-CTERM sorting domain-containing protein [Armatimonadota bacterium]|nr:PEP-CTERM sorting domain-containing protein [Armatimonadota bacterium]
MRARYCLLVVLPAAVAQAGSFHQLGFLGQNGPSIAYGISADGNTVVGSSISNAGEEAFRWTRTGGMRTLGDFPGGYVASWAYAVNNDGTIIVGGSDDGGAPEEGAGFRWTLATGLVHIGNLGGPSTYSPAYAVSDNGNVIAGISQNPTWDTEAFRWTAAGGMQGLGYLNSGSHFSKATGMTPDGNTVVGFAPGGYYYQAFRWTPLTGMQVIPNLDTASAISRNGQIVVGMSSGTAARWNGFATVILFTTTQGSSQATACSADGSVVVGVANYDPQSSSARAFVWDETHGMRTVEEVAALAGINMHGFQATWATGISADGKVICGWGFSQTNQEAWVLNLRKEPSRRPANR